MPSPRKTLLLGLMTAGLLITAVVVVPRFWSEELDLPVGVTRAQYDQVARSWQLKHSQVPDRLDVLVTLGDKLVIDDTTLEAAVACYDTIPMDHVHGPGARLEAAKALMRLNRGRDAERNLREFIDCVGEESLITHQQFVEALDMLRFLLEVQLRFEERKDVLRVVHLIGEAGPFETMAYCFPTLLRWNGPQSVQWLETLWEEDPGDLSLRIALGRYRIGEGRLDEAEEILLPCVAEAPHNLHGQAALVACYYEQDDWAKMTQAIEALPARGSSDPWLLLRLRGHLHNHEGRFMEASQCFEQVLEADPANGESYLGLARTYRGLDRPDARQAALRKSQVLARIQNRLGKVLSQEPDAETLLEIVDLCVDVDLIDEGLLVTQLALKVEPGNATASARVAQLESLRRRPAEQDEDR